MAFALAAVLLLVGPSSAVACTRPLYGRPYDQATATLAAEGWIERIVPRPDLYVPFDPLNLNVPSSPFTPLDVVIRAEAAYKGLVPNLFIFREAASLMALVDAAGNVVDQEWAGSSGACGLFDDDPTGRYILIALMEHPSAPSPGIIQTVQIGRTPYDPWIVQLRQEIQAAPPPSEPPRIVPAVAPIPASDLASWATSLVPLPILLAMLIAAGGVLSLMVAGGVQKWMQRRR